MTLCDRTGNPVDYFNQARDVRRISSRFQVNVEPGRNLFIALEATALKDFVD